MRISRGGVGLRRAAFVAEFSRERHIKEVVLTQFQIESKPKSESCEYHMNSIL